LINYQLDITAEAALRAARGGLARHRSGDTRRQRATLTANDQDTLREAFQLLDRYALRTPRTFWEHLEERWRGLEGPPRESSRQDGGRTGAPARG
jgi:hypothetical protein